MKKILTTLLVVISTTLLGQGFTYSYVDPCSRQVKTLQVSNNQAITVNYLGNINSFSTNDFMNGTFDAWVNQITASVANQPCDELLTNTQTSQNMFITQNLISTLTSVTAASSMTASNAISNSVSNSSSSSPKSKRGGNNSSNSNNQSNTSTDGTNNNSQGNSSSSSTSQGGGTQQGGSTSSGSSTAGGSNSQGGGNNQSSGVSQGGSGQTQRGVNPQSGSNNSQEQSQGQAQGQNVSDGPKQESNGSSGAGGTTNSVSNAAEATSSGSSGKGGRPRVGSIVGTGDIVAIRVNEDKSNQLRGTMSITKSNTNNTRAKGILLNYTTTVNNSNLTMYGAFKNKKGTNTFIVANSSMLDFERNFFNTTTALESKTFGKTALMGGLNFTVGGLGGEVFTNISAVGGGFHPFKISKNLTGNVLVLGVYSPFTKFYEGKWWDSGWLIVPFSSWDYAISKNFKYNVSLSGTYELRGSVLQFQILTGGKILL